MRSIAAAIAIVAISAQAQVVYKCGNAYTDKPCKGGEEIDIRPTEGAHSYSGTKRQSNEAVMRDFHRNWNMGLEQGTREFNRINQCESLMQERRAIDAQPKRSEAMEERRFQIRKSQYALGCKNT